MKQRISVVVMDLDNTLFDWVDIWYKSFKAMLDRLVLDSEISEETLLTEFKTIHERYQTSEYAFSIQELPSLKAKYPGEDLAKRFNEAIHAYRRARKSVLQLYPTVEETLQTLKDKGCILIGYTESLSFYSRYRIRYLGLDRLLDYLYSPPDHQLPAGLKPRQVRLYSDDQYQLRRTIHRPLPKGEVKPNPKVLLDIIRSVGAFPYEAIYVGDSVTKDISMAQTAGLTDVWAKYGVAYKREEYDLLRRVTHWKKNDVDREKTITDVQIKPSFALEESFGQLLDLFEYTPFLNKSKEMLILISHVWKKTVDVQQHFNDLELRIRNFALAALAAIVGLAAYGVKEQLRFTIHGYSVSVATAMFLSSLFIWAGFYFMDRFWYHNLLYGAVDHGRFIENRWRTVLPEISLTDSIRQSSPNKLFGLEIHTTTKINIFYVIGAIFLLLLGLIAQFAVPQLQGKDNTSDPSDRQILQLHPGASTCYPTSLPPVVNKSLTNP